MNGFPGYCLKHDLEHGEESCPMCNKADGLHGSDNVSVLFPDKPSAAPLPPQPQIVQLLDEYGVEAAGGKMVGLLIIGIRDDGSVKAGISGKVGFRDGVAALEQMKFGILARDYIANVPNTVVTPT